LSKTDENRDFLKRRNYPRQSYALSGIDWGDAASLSKTRSKLSIVGAPMFVSSMPPGASANREDFWQATYGASQDAYLSLIDGSSIQNNSDAVVANLDAIYRKIFPTAENTNIYQKVNGSQQVQFIVSKNDPETFRQSNDAGDTTELRTIGQRIPATAAGWGKTVMLRPTDPDPADPRVNDDEHKMDRSTWPVGPIDYRWHPGRRAWTTFNDLIVDDRSKALGTPVFSSNPDSDCGMPFLKGFLDDVWRIRRTNDENLVSVIQDPNFQFFRFDGGEICTILSHKVFDPNTNDVAALSDVFIAHGGDSSATCGDETTNTGGQLEIKTTAYFHLNDEVHGPVCFDANGPGADEDVGRMGFTDGQFCPIVPKELDSACSNPTYATHMAKLFNNDVEITEEGILTLQNFVCDWNEDYTQCLMKWIAWAGQNANSAVWALNFLIPLYLKLLANSIASSVGNALASSMQSLVGNIEASMQLFGNQISNCFIAAELPACPLEFSLSTPSISVVAPEVPDIEVPGFDPPACQIQSFAAWEDANDKELNFSIENPCGGVEDYVASCSNPGIPGLPDIDWNNTGDDDPSIGGVDDNGDINLGGVDFGNTGNNGTSGDPNAGPNGNPANPFGSPAGAEAPGSD